MATETLTETPANRLRLGDLKRAGQRTGFSAPILTGFNLGNRTVNLVIPMDKFKEISAIANEARIIPGGGDDHGGGIAQRPLDESHAKKIAMYILRGLLSSVKIKYLADDVEIPEVLEDLLGDLGEGPYQGLQPFTGNIRNCQSGGDDLEVEKMPDGSLVLHLRQGQIIMVVDGQHRRWGYNLLTDWLDDILATGRYSTTRKGGLYMPEGREDIPELTADELAVWGAVYEEARAHCTVDVTVHLGLRIDQERQLFHDLNNLGKKVEPSIAQAFDQANPVNIFIRKDIEGKNLLGEIKISDEGSKKGGKKRAAELTTDGSIIRDDLVIANGLLFAGMTNPTGIPKNKVDSKLGERFWKAISSQPHFGEAGWHEKTLLAQPTMIKALAQLAYNFNGSREADEKNLDAFLTALEENAIDFSAENPLWKAYLVDDYEMQFPGISEYLTPTGVRNSYATVDPATNFVRFTSNTRDVARYIGDLIRWQLKLPVRPGLIQLRKKMEEEAAANGNGPRPTDLGD
jgi:hypothetical protein